MKRPYISETPIFTFVTLTGLAIVLVIVCLVRPAIALSAEAPRAKRVLMLFSENKFLPGNALVEQAAKKVLEQSGHPLEFYAEYLDASRFSSRNHYHLFREYLQEKYGPQPPDLILAFLTTQFELAGQLPAELFPKAPVVFGALTEDKIPRERLGANATGIAVRMDVKGALATIMKLQPETKTIVVIGGTAPLDKLFLSKTEEAARSLSGRIQFDFWVTHPLVELRRMVAALPPRTVILFANMFRDAAGETFVPEAAASLVAVSANVPVYVLIETNVGGGAVGGKVVHFEAAGKRVGELARRVLDGAAPASIPIEVREEGAPIFDWRALKRWGISESRLPPGSIIRFREPSIWDLYKWYIIGAFALMAIQAVMIATLLLHRTRRRRAESELRESEEKFGLAAESANLGVWSWDISNDYIWATEKCRDLYGFRPEQEIHFQTFVETLHAGDRERIAQAVERVLRGSKDFAEEYRVVLPGGTIRWIGAFGRGSYDSAGKFIRMLGVSIDITERKRMEETLMQEREFLRQVIDVDPNFIFAKDREGHFTLANQAVADAYGTTVENLVGKTDKDFNPNREEVEFFRRMDQEVIDMMQERFIPEERITDAQGKVRWLQTVKRPIVMSDGQARQVLGSATDITERKRAEEKFRLAVEASPNAIVMLNEQGQIVLVNVLTEKLFGYDRDELIGQSVDILVPERFRADHPAHRAGFFAAPQTRAMGAGRDLFARRKDGSEFLVEIGLNPIQTTEGVFVLTAIVDITERKRAEIEQQRNREDLAHVTRISTMGELAASLAHELNQPLTAILSNAQAALRFLAAKPADLEEIKDILQDIVEDNSRAGEVIRRMRALVKKEALAPVALDLGGVVREVMQLVHSDAMLRNIRISLECKSKLPFVRGDKVQLQQVVLNLLLNAFDAMRECPADERQVLVRVDSGGNGMVKASVRDRGTGLTTDKLDKIFQPFFTTKRDGLGMGLSISRSIVEAQGGRLWAENNPTRGATFHVVLPAFADVEQKSENPA